MGSLQVLLSNIDHTFIFVTVNTVSYCRMIGTKRRPCHQDPTLSTTPPLLAADCIQPAIYFNPLGTTFNPLATDYNPRATDYNPRATDTILLATDSIPPVTGYILRWINYVWTRANTTVSPAPSPPPQWKQYNSVFQVWTWAWVEEAGKRWVEGVWKRRSHLSQNTLPTADVATTSNVMSLWATRLNFTGLCRWS